MCFLCGEMKHSDPCPFAFRLPLAQPMPTPYSASLTPWRPAEICVTLSVSWEMLCVCVCDLWAQMNIADALNQIQWDPSVKTTTNNNKNLPRVVFREWWSFGQGVIVRTKWRERFQKSSLKEMLDVRGSTVHSVHDQCAASRNVMIWVKLLPYQNMSLIVQML